MGFSCNDRMIELKEYEPDMELLGRIAAAGGGKLFMPNEKMNPDEVLRAVEKRSSETSGTYRPIWDKLVVLIVICAFLTGEWLLRRRQGLP